MALRSSGPEWEKFEAANGVRIVCRRMSHARSVAVGLWLGVGSRYEAPCRSGIAHLAEHMAFKGTRTRTCAQIKEAIEGVGGSFNAFTSEELTCYWIRILADRLELCLDILSDMITAPLLDPSDIAREKDVIIEEIRMSRDHPSFQAQELFDRTLFPSHPLGRPVSGTVGTVRGFSASHLRRFIRTRYSAPNLVLSVSGNFRTSRLHRLADRFLQKIPGGTANRFQTWLPPPASAPRTCFLRRKAEQTHLCLGTTTWSRFDPRRYSLAVLNTVLGGNMSSRLFSELRDRRGLAYDVRSSVRLFHDTGALVVSAGVPHSRAEEVLRIILAEFQKLRNVPLESAELERARLYLTSQFLMGLEDTFETMAWLGEQTLLRGEPIGVREVCDAIRSVTEQDVLSTARLLLAPDGLRATLVGPRVNASTIRSLLGER